MSELEVFAQGEKAGALELTHDGLFYEFSGTIRAEDGIVRLYAVAGWDSEYLGIPEPQVSGLFLRVRLPVSHFAEEPVCVVADRRPRGAWLPWRGLLDGVPVCACRLRRTEDGLMLALPLHEAEQLPLWLPHMQETELDGERVWLLHLNADGTPPFKIEEPEPMPEEPAPEETSESDATPEKAAEVPAEEEKEE